MTCDINANIVPRTGTLEALVGGSGVTGLSGNAGEIASTTDTQDIVKFNGVAGGAVSFSPGHNVLNLQSNADNFNFTAVTHPRLATAAYDRINVTIEAGVLSGGLLWLPDGQYAGQRLEVSYRVNGAITDDNLYSTMEVKSENGDLQCFIGPDQTCILEWDPNANGAGAANWRAAYAFALAAKTMAGNTLHLFSSSFGVQGKPGAGSIGIGGIATGDLSVCLGGAALGAVHAKHAIALVAGSGSNGFGTYYPHVVARYTSMAGQWFDLILTGVTTGTSATRLSNDNSPVTTPAAFENNPNELIHPAIAVNGAADELWAVEVKFIGRNNASPAQACLYHRQFLVTCVGTGSGATLAVVGMSTVGTDYDPNALASAPPSIAPNAATKALEFTVQGKASTTVQWVADVKWTSHTNRATSMVPL